MEAIQRLIKDDLDPEVVELATFGIFFAVAMDQTFRGKSKDLAVTAEQLTSIAVSGFGKESDKH